MCSPYALKIYIDGSALKNPGNQVGIGGIVEFPDSFNRAQEEIFWLKYESGTNQTMELNACIKALEYVRKNLKILGINHAIILTDSKYVFDNQNFAAFWKKNKWRKKDGGPVKNYRTWDEFLSARGKTGVLTEIKWNKGKKSQILKDVDKLAKKAAGSIIGKKDFLYNPGKITKRKSHVEKICVLYPAKGQGDTIRIYGEKDVSTPGKNECEIKFELWDRKNNRCEGNYFAYFQGDVSLLHRGNYYKVTFNSNENYPIIEKLKQIKLK